MRAEIRPPRVLLAPDSFKGGLSAREVVRELGAGLRAVDPEVHLIPCPLADGGEGTVDVLAGLGAVVRRKAVTGPLGRAVPACWAELDGVAYVEVAQAAGHALVERQDAATALAASTTGVGELVAAALDAGCRRLVLTVGGSASTDGGAGMLRALGARLLDARGRSVPGGGAGLLSVDRVDLSGLDPRLGRVPVTVACDVANPLLGAWGSATVFGPQKGAGPGEVPVLDSALRRWVAALDVVAAAPVRQIADQPGSGAGGGIGFAAMAVLGAAHACGADLILDLLDVDSALHTADFVITGEGSFDHQTLRGKAPGVLARRARARAVPVAVVAGAVALDSITLRSVGVHAAWSLVDLAGGREQAVAGAAPLVRRCGSEAMRWWRRRDSR